METSLEGRFVRLEPLGVHHVAEMAAAASADRATFELTIIPSSPEAMADYVAVALKAAQDKRMVPYATRRLSDGALIGGTRFSDLEWWRWPEGARHQRTGRPDAVEIGYTWLIPSAQRTGVNLDAKLTMLTYAFETWEVHRVRLRTDVRNTRSRNAIEGLGARFEGVVRADRPGADDTVRDSAYYSIVAAEWPEVREHLVARLERAPR